MEMIQTANLALRFGLELCVLAALAYWGFKHGRGRIAKFGLAIGAPLLAALVWILFGAPGAAMELRDPLHLILELAFFGSAIVALYLAGRSGMAWTIGLAALVNRVLMYLWGQ